MYFRQRCGSGTTAKGKVVSRCGSESKRKEGTSYGRYPAIRATQTLEKELRLIWRIVFFCSISFELKTFMKAREREHAKQKNSVLDPHVFCTSSDPAFDARYGSDHRSECTAVEITIAKCRRPMGLKTFFAVLLSSTPIFAGASCKCDKKPRRDSSWCQLPTQGAPQYVGSLCRSNCPPPSEKE